MYVRTPPHARPTFLPAQHKFVAAAVKRLQASDGVSPLLAELLESCAPQLQKFREKTANEAGVSKLYYLNVHWAARPLTTHSHPPTCFTARNIGATSCYHVQPTLRRIRCL